MNTPRRIYVDGVWDCYHKGHVRHLKECKYLENRENTLIVGVISDVDAESYKRKPLYDESHRAELVTSCRHVDEVIETPPLRITKKFLIDNRIDLVCHAFSTSQEAEFQTKGFFSIPEKLGLFRALKYTPGVSTTQILAESKTAQARRKTAVADE